MVSMLWIIIIIEPHMCRKKEDNNISLIWWNKIRPLKLISWKLLKTLHVYESSSNIELIRKRVVNNHM